MNNNSKNPSDSAYDDLTAIKGIKQARQQWLREVFDVRSYADLAALTVDEIHARLKKNQIVSRNEIESWIQQARKLAGSKQRGAKAGKNGWHPFAYFVVEYQKNEQTGELRTYAHHMEADQTMVWPGMEHHEVCHWMVEQLDVSVTAESAPVAAEAPQLAPVIAPAEPAAPIVDTYRSLSDQLHQLLEALTKVAILPASQAIHEPAPAPAATPQPVATPPLAESAAKPSSSFNERRRKALAKAAAVQPVSQPAIQPVLPPKTTPQPVGTVVPAKQAKPTVNTSPSFSPGLQEVLTKAAAIQPVSQPAVEPVLPPKTTAQLSGVLQAGYSEELQRILAKAQRLSNKVT